MQRTAEAMARASGASNSALPVSRYVTGVAAPDLSGLDPRPATPAASAVERTEVVPATAVEVYPSELPDLSGPMPKPAMQRPGT